MSLKTTSIDEVPADLLGLQYRRWTRSSLRIILGQYGKHYAHGVSKEFLMCKLDWLTLERGLTRSDRCVILGAHARGTEPPELKPIIEQPSREKKGRPQPKECGEERAASIRSRRAYTTARNAASRMTLASNASSAGDALRSDAMTETATPQQAFPEALAPTTQIIPSATIAQTFVAPTSEAAPHDPPANEGPMDLAPDVAHSPTQAPDPVSEPVEDPIDVVPVAQVIRECEVCLESLTPDTTPQRIVTFACQHEIDTCQQCLVTSLSTQMSEKMWDQINCPSCGERLSSDDVQVLADKQTRERYNNLAFEAHLASSQQFQHCRHPGCDSGGSYDPNQTQWTLCEVYAGRTCVQCDLIWDDGHSCVDVAARRAANEVRSGQEAATLEYLSKETKDCPKCGYHTEKSGGCDHMRCRKCEHQYCWICFADWKPIARLGNAHHRSDCKYNTDNLRGGTPVPE